MKPITIKILLTVLFVIGAIILILGCVGGFVIFPNLIEGEIIKNVELKSGTKQFDRFLEVPFPVAFKVTFFVVKNGPEALNGAVPVLEEKGPYVFDEIKRKEVTYLKKDEIGYNEKWSFNFSSAKSNGLSDEDVITVVNAPLVAIMQKLEDLPSPLPMITVEELTSQLFENTNLFMDIKVKDLAFGGVTICDPARTTKFASKMICLATMIMNQKLLEYNDDRSMSFSLFNYKTKADGPFGVVRGIFEPENLGLIKSFKNQKYTSFWNGEETSCDKIEGFGTTFPPFVKKDTSYKVYSTDICKTAQIHYTDEATFKGVKGYRFQMDKNSFSSPEDTCTCIKETKDIDGSKTCFTDALLDLHNCFGGSPVVLSFPHLMWANKIYQKSVKGLKSRFTDDHNTFIIFEPHLGIPLRGAIRIQFNVVMRPMIYAGKEVIEDTKDLKPAMVPILWLEDGFELTDDLIKEINEELLDNLVLVEYVKWIAIGVGGVIIILTVALCIFCCKRMKGTEYV